MDLLLIFSANVMTFFYVISIAFVMTFYLPLRNLTFTPMAKKTSYLQVKLSDSLKDSLEAMCQEREISMSDLVRDLIANSVRSYKRQNAKTAEAN